MCYVFSQQVINIYLLFKMVKNYIHITVKETFLFPHFNDLHQCDVTHNYERKRLLILFYIKVGLHQTITSSLKTMFFSMIYTHIFTTVIANLQYCQVTTKITLQKQ